MDLVADACLAARHAFGGEPRALSNVLWNMSRLGHVDELFYLAFVPGEQGWGWGGGRQRAEGRGTTQAQAGEGNRGQGAARLPAPRWQAAALYVAPYVAAPSLLRHPPAVILPSIERYGPSELADVARVYSRNGLNPGDERGGGGTLFDALARQTVDRIQGADLQDVLRRVAGLAAG